MKFSKNIINFFAQERFNFIEKDVKTNKIDEYQFLYKERIPIEIRILEKDDMKCYLLEYLKFCNFKPTKQINEICTMLQYCNILYEIKDKKINIIKECSKESVINLDEIIKIDHNKDLKETFDLFVADGNSYLANGLLVHNTLNLKNDVKEEVVEDIYMNAWKMGLKSVTVYREGSREGILITEEQENKNKEDKEVVEVKQKVKKIERPITLSGLTYKIPYNPDEKIYVTINSREDDPIKPFEIFLGTFGQDNPELQTITVLLSALMRNVDDIKFIIEDLKKITSSGAGKWWHDVEDKRRYYINSVPTAVAIALEKFINRNIIREKQVIQLENIDEDHLEKCPRCGSISYINENGCGRCINENCGFSKCD